MQARGDTLVVRCTYVVQCLVFCVFVPALYCRMMASVFIFSVLLVYAKHDVDVDEPLAAASLSHIKRN